jgi:hypothetical protein
MTVENRFTLSWKCRRKTPEAEPILRASSLASDKHSNMERSGPSAEGIYHRASTHLINMIASAALLSNSEI